MGDAHGKTYRLPIGPVHVGLKEPITAWLTLDGERILEARIRPGAIHRGIERMARDRNPVQVIYLAERICGICSFTHIVAFVRAVEEAAGIPVPRRARWIRSLLLELERIHSHILWAGVACYTIGFDSAFHLGMIMREKVLDVLEAFTGNRVNYGVGTIGGVRRDMTPQVARAIREMSAYYRREFGEFLGAVVEDPVARARMRDVGVLPPDEAVRFCALGPTLRGSGHRVDLRTCSPYEAYGELMVEPVVPQDVTGQVRGDVFDRFLVRVGEVEQSLDLIDRIREGMPAGDLASEPSLPRLLARLKGAEGTGWGIIEGPRGDDTHVVHLSKGDENVTWWKVRAPTYANAVSWPVMFREQDLADASLIINSVDPCISCMERTALVAPGGGLRGVLDGQRLLEMSREKSRRMTQGGMGR